MYDILAYHECSPAFSDDFAAYWVIALLMAGLIAAVILLRPASAPPASPLAAKDVGSIFDQMRAEATTFNRDEYHRVLNDAEARTIAFLKKRGLV